MLYEERYIDLHVIGLLLAIPLLCIHTTHNDCKYVLSGDITGPCRNNFLEEETDLRKGSLEFVIRKLD